MPKYTYLAILSIGLLIPNTRSTYSVGDTLTIEDQNREYNVCHTDGNYEIGDSFSFSDYNGEANGGSYKVFLISMNATWWPACYDYVSLMDSILNYTNQNEELEFIVSLDYHLEDFSDFECQEWGDLYEELGIYGNNPLILNGDTDFDSDGEYDHYIWNMFAGSTYSSYAMIDHRMVVQHLFDEPDFNDFQNVHLPNLINQMYGCTDPNALNFDPTPVYLDSSCIYGGDFNDDSMIDVNDVVILLDMILNFELDNQGDLNMDANTDLLDIIVLVNFILN